MNWYSKTEIMMDILIGHHVCFVKEIFSANHQRDCLYRHCRGPSPARRHVICVFLCGNKMAEINVICLEPYLRHLQSWRIVNEVNFRENAFHNDGLMPEVVFWSFPIFLWLRRLKRFPETWKIKRLVSGMKQRSPSLCFHPPLASCVCQRGTFSFLLYARKSIPVSIYTVWGTS